MTLAEFLAARLGEVAALAESAARCRGEYEWYPEPQIIADGLNLPDAQFIRYWDPARVLRQVAAMRAILAMHRAYEETDRVTHRCYVCASDHAYKSGAAIQELHPCPTLRHMAAIWSDHPDYQQEWKPA